MEVLMETKGSVCTIIINRPEARNAVNRKTADMLADAFRTFDRDYNLSVA
ncbi:MAG: enoyl-CoA hydratase, partial [Syntrophomonadaceae bacterium]|nr:enoyl-CoA hydratase [Syntrophomonadaceae bacterium]